MDKLKTVDYLNRNMKKVILVVSFIFGSQLSASQDLSGTPCADPNVQTQRSQELQKILKADQDDREWQKLGEQPIPQILNKMSRNDLIRRKRIGQIFGEGCLRSADDYEAAFTVFQHGNTPDQYFQAFIWSKQALALGKTHMKSEVAMAVDRYLVSIGHKQLFGTQAFQENLGGCWCIRSIEESFPQTLRNEYRGGSTSAYTGLAYLKVLNDGKNCPTSYCSQNLQPSPQGTIPGFW